MRGSGLDSAALTVIATAIRSRRPSGFFNTICAQQPIRVTASNYLRDALGEFSKEVRSGRRAGLQGGPRELSMSAP